VIKSQHIIWAIILADLLAGLLQTIEMPFFRIGLLLKSIIIFFVFLKSLVKIKKKSIKSIYISIAILSTFWLIGAFVSFTNYSEFSLSNSIVVLNRYLFFLILSCAFLDWSTTEYFEIECKKIFERFLILNNAFIFIGFVFSVQVFKTYNEVYSNPDAIGRFGYKGLIFGQNSVAAIYTLGIAFLFREYLVYKQKKTTLLIGTCLAAMLLGTKAAPITLVLLSLYFLLVYRVQTLIELVAPTLLGLSYLVISNWNIVQERYLSFLLQKYETMDFYTFWTSNRNQLLSNALERVSKHWSSINFLVGDADSYVEMDFFDLYFFFGFGALVYFFVYFKIFFLKDKSRDNKYVFLVFMAMAFVAGHVINSAIVPLFLLLYVFSTRSTQKQTD
jgi:hypothetical protein